MARLAIVGMFEIAPGRRDELLAALTAHRDRCLKDEPGTLQFEVLVPRDDATRLHLYEVYRDDAAFEVHYAGSSIARWREDTAGMVTRMSVTRCAVAD